MLNRYFPYLSVWSFLKFPLRNCQTVRNISFLWLHKKKDLLLSVGEFSFWTISVGEGFPQRHQGYQTQHKSTNMGMYVISGTPRRDLDARNALFVLEEDGFIHKTRSATVHRNSSRRPPPHRERTLWIYNWTSDERINKSVTRDLKPKREDFSTDWIGTLSY